MGTIVRPWAAAAMDDDSKMLGYYSPEDGWATSH